MGYRKGLWSPDEDQKLSDFVRNHGNGNWNRLAERAGLQRTGKSCRLRWINYLRPGLKHGLFTQEEERLILNLHAIWGSKWSNMARYLPDRTDNEIKNYWNSCLRKRAKNNQSTNWSFSNSITLDFTSQSSIDWNMKFRLNIDVDQSKERVSKPPIPILFEDWLLMINDNSENNSKLNSKSSYIVRTAQISNCNLVNDFRSSGVIGDFESQVQYQSQGQGNGLNGSYFNW